MKKITHNLTAVVKGYVVGWEGKLFEIEVGGQVRPFLLK